MVKDEYFKTIRFGQQSNKDKLANNKIQGGIIKSRSPPLVSGSKLERAPPVQPRVIYSNVKPF